MHQNSEVKIISQVNWGTETWCNSLAGAMTKGESWLFLVYNFMRNGSFGCSSIQRDICCSLGKLDIKSPDSWPQIGLGLWLLNASSQTRPARHQIFTAWNSCTRNSMWKKANWSFCQKKSDGNDAMDMGASYMEGGRLLEAEGADFEEQQMEHLMIVDLWCAQASHQLGKQSMFSILKQNCQLFSITNAGRSILRFQKHTHKEAMGNLLKLNSSLGLLYCIFLLSSFYHSPLLDSCGK